MKNIIFIITVLTIFTSCRKTEVEAEDLYTTVYYKPLIQQSFKAELKSAPIKPEVLGNDFIINSIKQVNIKATNVASGYSVYEEFPVNVSGNDVMALTNVQIGQTYSAVKTLSKQVYAANDHNKDGIAYSTYSGNTEDFVNELRSIYPYITFYGLFEHNVSYDHNDNIVEGEMTANNGRLIITIQLADELKTDYYGKGILSINGFTSDKNWFNRQDKSSAYFYLSNEMCHSKNPVSLAVYLFDRQGNIVNNWTLTSDNWPGKIGIENGVDRWTDITITKNAAVSSVVQWDLEFPWSEDEHIMGLE